MKFGYIKTNINVMKFDCVKDIDKIMFNHYIMRRENLNRIQKELPIGQFTLTVTGVSTDLNIPRVKAQRLIQEFQQKKIIKVITKGTVKDKKFSVYEYITGDTLSDTENDTVKTSNTKGYMATNETDSKTSSETYKKDNLNIKLNNKEIYIRIVDYLNETTGKSFKPTTQKTVTCIKARLKEGFIEEDFYKVIDIKSKQWLHSNMSKFLRPETLFSNKFEGYLNEEVLDNREYEEDVHEWDIEFEY